MENQEHDIELIENYLEDNLSKDKRLEVEKRLSIDPDFKSLQDDLKHFREGSTQVYREQLLEYLQKRDQKMGPIPISSVKQLKMSRRKWYYGIAATIITISIGYWLIQNLPEKKTPEELFIAYYEPYPNLIAPNQRINEEVADELKPIEQAMIFYDAGKYSDAADALNTLNEHEKDGIIFLYLGICYIESGETIYAVEAFENAVQIDSSLVWQSVWYKGLAYLKAGNKNQAIKNFEQLIDNNTPFKERSIKITESI